ncbi:transporter substrate-binding domain-containing protein [Candidatus Liberibacter asiaticus]|uniref:Amino acid-binding periplasmic ABC transporter protein n=3 Tax=Liberibacter asiaticus TaxID=34021 RepID=A0ABM5NHB0_LIBAS|nr:transporter substrate-binding domain-containing protein [Candidatus Liberibacter asiaticus]ACT57585.1 putative amino acid-binding periplasmic ABC transporter protein [Candidatus Liberibacter asiaticus str. psy62]AGH17348.1 putative amino acid-binding periplasmic ABC transporter protein [Candidatus Liberibacter asiaticus str. gxpsy]ALK07630.1 transporter substrate-binding domain-containing protein [Candidatus Liberibacter asiaticus]ASK53122.1 amino acid ABC transporter substrate-binding prote
MRRLLRDLRKIFFSKYLFFAPFFILFSYYFVIYPFRTEDQSALRVGTDGIYPPHSFHAQDGRGELTGFDIDLIKEVAHRLNLKVEFFETAVSGLITGLDTNRYDVLVNVAITPERQKKYDFSIPYIAHRVLLVVRSDQQDIRSFKDLTDKTVAQILGTDLSRFAKELKSHLVFSHNFEQSLQLLLSKRTDATMIPDIPFFNFLERRPHDGNLFKIADRMKDNSAVAFMMRKGNNKLTRSINEILCAIHLDGTYKKIFDRYFDKNIISSVPGCSS